MNIADSMKQTGALDSISRELGVDSATARSGAEALLPAILGGFKKEARPAPGGLGGLAPLIDLDGDGTTTSWAWRDASAADTRGIAN